MRSSKSRKQPPRSSPLVTFEDTKKNEKERTTIGRGKNEYDSTQFHKRKRQNTKENE